MIHPRAAVNDVLAVEGHWLGAAISASTYDKIRTIPARFQARFHCVSTARFRGVGDRLPAEEAPSQLSILTPALRITAPQRSVSDCMKAAVSAGVRPIGSAERSSRRFRTSGLFAASAPPAALFSPLSAARF